MPKNSRVAMPRKGFLSNAVGFDYDRIHCVDMLINLGSSERCCPSILEVSGLMRSQAGWTGGCAQTQLPLWGRVT
jgi:hypothetical protein